MIAMRVTFSRACARARKKKVILCARKCAQKCARESEEEMKKNAFFRYRYKIHENSLSQTFIKTAVCLIFDFKEEEKTERESRERKERN